jgi:hypothetical protein
VFQSGFEIRASKIDIYGVSSIYPVYIYIYRTDMILINSVLNEFLLHIALKFILMLSTIKLWVLFFFLFYFCYFRKLWHNELDDSVFVLAKSWVWVPGQGLSDTCFLCMPLFPDPLLRQHFGGHATPFSSPTTSHSNLSEEHAAPTTRITFDLLNFFYFLTLFISNQNYSDSIS